MKLHGKSVIAGRATDSTAGFFSARGNLARFEEATAELVHQAFDEANLAFLGDDLLAAASTETSLPRCPTNCKTPIRGLSGGLLMDN